MCVSAVSAGEMATQMAAITQADLPPPSSRVKLAVIGTRAAAARAAGRRSSQTSTPKSCVAAAMRGTSGGWSAYPNAGWRPQTM